MERTYVVQVAGGRERRALELIQAMVPKDLASEVFVPSCERHVTLGGGASRIELVDLAPGYLYLTTPDISATVSALREVPALTRVLGNADGFVPLTEQELAWFHGLTSPGKRTVGMSTAVKEGSAVRIIDGPLVGYEALVTRVDAHKRLAWVRFPVMGRDTIVKLGLNFVRNAT